MGSHETPRGVEAFTSKPVPPVVTEFTCVVSESEYALV